MVWSLVMAMVISASPLVKLTKGAFVGAFNTEGQPISVTAPLEGKWVSKEQVQREILFRNLKLPLNSAQMAEVAKGLDADFAADVLVSVSKIRQRYHLLAVLRCVSAYFGTIVHIDQEQSVLSNLDQIASVVDKLAQSMLSRIPNQISLATVQLREGERRVHLTATSGQWKRGLKVIFIKESSGQITLVGEGQIVSASLLAGSNKWLLEADLKDKKLDIRTGDKAIQVFKLPKPFEKWQ
ncbi:MAG: hypothetical protein NZ805_01515 [Armatimonadetes bacterium]|nr:hypothetical protein [Armatimonadota bacterium]MDW8027585.1 hypothetical protein [Armatimonadota bacterium]